MADTVALSPERRFELSEQANRKVLQTVGSDPSPCM